MYYIFRIKNLTLLEILRLILIDTFCRNFYDGINLEILGAVGGVCELRDDAKHSHDF